jgi:SAM-dependent methyltransferase
LPYFIKERKYTTGLELGAKAGRSMYYTLKANKSLHLTGIDLWEIIPGGAYKKNNRNEDKCKRLLQKFSSRITLIKGDAFTIADTIENKSFDFIFYDLQCKTMSNFHKDMIAKWLPKIKTGGVLIGRDFREFRQTFYELGFEDIQKLMDLSLSNIHHLYHQALAKLKIMYGRKTNEKKRIRK